MQKYWEKKVSTYIFIHPTCKRRTSDLQKLNIGPTKLNIESTKVEHSTYKSWTFDLQKLNFGPKKVEHSTLNSWTSDLQKLNILPSKVEHPTYKAIFNQPTNSIIIIIINSRVRPAIKLNKLNIRPTIFEHQTNSPAPEHPTYKTMFNRPTNFIIRTSLL